VIICTAGECRRRQLGATQFSSPARLGKWQSRETAVLGEISTRSKYWPRLIIRELCGLGPVRRAREALWASRPHHSHFNLRAADRETDLSPERLIRSWTQYLPFSGREHFDRSDWIFGHYDLLEIESRQESCGAWEVAINREPWEKLWAKIWERL